MSGPNTHAPTINRLWNLRPLPGGVVLDVGCGGGVALDLLGQAFKPGEIVGIDIDVALVEQARQTSAGSSTCIGVHEGTVYAFAVESESVDVVFCHQLLHHLTHQSQTLSEINRVLKPGGLLMVSEYCNGGGSGHFFDTPALNKNQPMRIAS